MVQVVQILRILHDDSLDSVANKILRCAYVSERSLGGMHLCEPDALPSEKFAYHGTTQLRAFFNASYRAWVSQVESM